jgi:integrase
VSGGRRPTGTIKWRHNPIARRMQWYARVTLKSGSRPWVELDPSIPEHDEEGARRCALDVSLEARHSGVVPTHVKETVAEYAKRWLESRDPSVPSNEDNRSHLNTHVIPIIGQLDMRTIGRQQIEALVSKLDAKVTAGKMSPKTAKNVWGTCSKMFDDATNAKPATGMRLLDADPTLNVRGPDDDGTEKALQFLYPSEFSAFMTSTDVPRPWKRNVAIALYLCLRDGEQRALGWPAVDLVHGVVTVEQTADRRTGVVRDGTKSKTARSVPIPTPLLPVLEAMKKRAKGKGLVCPDLPSNRNMVRGLHLYLKRAGVTRQALFKTTKVSKNVRWHDLRATGLTWYAVAGRPSTEIRDIAGHSNTSQTDRYMRSAGLMRGGRFGTPFPVLPAGLVPLREQSSLNRPGTELAAVSIGKVSTIQRRGRDSNPRRSLSPAPA